MSAYLTTYHRDYIWPNANRYNLKASPFQNVPVIGAPLKKPREYDACECPKDVCRPAEGHPPSARVGAAPEVDTSRHDQPNQYLKKLQDKYPYLYKVLRSYPPDDLMARIYRDRLRTTYQTDFCKKGEYPADDYKHLKEAVGFTSDRRASAGTAKGELVDPCKCVGEYLDPSKDKRRITYLNAKIGPEGGPPSSAKTSLKMNGISEYKDVISRNGYIINDYKLLHPKKPMKF